MSEHARLQHTMSFKKLVADCDVELQWLLAIDPSKPANPYDQIQTIKDHVLPLVDYAVRLSKTESPVLPDDVNALTLPRGSALTTAIEFVKKLKAWATKEANATTIPSCPNCGSAPAASDLDDVCPKCGAYKFRCGIAVHHPLGDAPPIRQQIHKPRWDRIPPSKVRKPTPVAPTIPPEHSDPSQCPGCKAPVPVEYGTLSRFFCPACGLWEMQTGLMVLPATGPASPSPIRIHAPLWRPVPPPRPGQIDQAANKPIVVPATAAPLRFDPRGKIELLTQEKLTALQDGDPHDTEVVRLAAECWKNCPSMRSSELVEDIRMTARNILYEFCRRNKLDGEYLDHRGRPIDAFKSWQADMHCGSFRRNEFAQRILLALGKPPTVTKDSGQKDKGDRPSNDESQSRKKQRWCYEQYMDHTRKLSRIVQAGKKVFGRKAPKSEAEIYIYARRWAEYKNLPFSKRI
jgi:hypothetical protein